MLSGYGGIRSGSMDKQIQPGNQMARSHSYQFDCSVLTSDNPTILQDWLENALAGDEVSRTRMFSWVHSSAIHYFETKSFVEPLLSVQDAQDLASECIEEFSKAWQRVRSVCHYCRRMFKNNLRRFLKRKRKGLQRECALMADAFEHYGTEFISVYPSFEFERFSDEDHRRRRVAESELRNADDIIKELFHYRVLVGSLTYREIADLLGATETSLRMRMARFNRRVRTRHDREEQRRRMQKEAAVTCS